MIKSTVSQEWHGNEVKIQGNLVINKSIYEIGLIVEGQAKLLAPKDTGYLAASITTQAYGGKGTDPEDPRKYASTMGKYTAAMASEGIEPTYKKNKKEYSLWEMTIQSPKEENQVIVGTALDYAPHQEFGTVRASAQPFLRPALDMARGKALTLVKLNSKIHFKEYLTEKDAYKLRNG